MKKILTRIKNSTLTYEESSFFLFNVVCIGILISAYFRGYVSMVIEGDQSRIVFIIASLLFIGVAISFTRMWEIVRGNNIKQTLIDNPDIAAEVMNRKINGIRHIATALVMLGLIGTVIGFIVVMKDVNPSAVSDVSAITSMVTKMLNGMGIALFTTLIGGIGNLWLGWNVHYLNNAGSRVYSNALRLKHKNENRI